MQATKASQADPAATLPVAPSATTDIIAARIFNALAPLHAQPFQSVELLLRAAAGLRFIRSTGNYTELEHDLFTIALAETDPAEAFVIETAACYAADLVPRCDPDGERAVGPCDRVQALWFAAILRVADAVSAGTRAPADVFAAWTDEVVYLEFDGAAVSERQVARARARVAALEAVAGRAVFVASTRTRRPAA